MVSNLPMERRCERGEQTRGTVPPGGRNAIIEIGSVKLLSSGRPYRATGWAGLRGRKLLVLFVALVLSGGAFVLAAGEVQAQQQPASPKKAYAAVAAPGSVRPAVVPPSASKDAPLTVGRRGIASTSRSGPPLEPTTTGEPEQDPGLSAEIWRAPGTGTATDLALPEALDPPTEPVIEERVPVPSFDALVSLGPGGAGLAQPDPGATVSSDYEPLLTGLEKEPPAILLPVPPPDRAPVIAAPDGPPLPAPGTSGRGVGPAPVLAVAQQTPPILSKSPAPVPESPEEARLPSGSVPAASGAVVAPHGTVHTGAHKKPSSTPSSGGTGSPRENAPSPPASPGGSSFSLAGVGQLGPGGGVAPLLLCVLTVGFILLRPQGGLAWASCDLPKPSSALLTPLERPG